MIRANTKNLAVGYVRRSTDRQEQSIDDQKKAIESYASENRLKLLKFYVDDAISGTSTIKRKAFLQMVRDAESSACKFSNIVVYDVKRFGRLDNDEAGFYRHILRSNGVDIQYVAENFNGDSTDDLLRPVKQWQARQESKDLSKVTIRGLLSKAETGAWLGGVPPYGYDLKYENSESKFLFIVRYMADRTKQVLDEKGNLTRTLSRDESIQVTKRDKASLVPSDKSRADIIKEVFESYANVGKGFKSIADSLNRRNIPTARNQQWARIYSGKWTGSAIRFILNNPLYAGDMVWNRRTDARFHKISNGIAVDRKDIHGHRLVPNDENDWIIIRDTHSALISRRLYELAKQRRLNKPESIEQKGVNHRLKSHGKTWDGKRSRFILSGIISCTKCSSRYQGVTKHKGKTNLDGTKTKTFYYSCGGYITKGKSVCQSNSIKKDILENTIIETILEYYSRYLQKDGRELLANIIKSQIQSEVTDFKAAKQRTNDEVQKVDSIINNLLDNLTSENRDLVDKRLNQLKQQKALLESRLEELGRLENSQVEIETMVSETLRFISALEFIFKQGLPQEKLVAIRQCIERIWINVAKKENKILIYVVPASHIKQTYKILQKFR